MPARGAVSCENSLISGNKKETALDKPQRFWLVSELKCGRFAGEILSVLQPANHLTHRAHKRIINALSDIKGAMIRETWQKN